MATGPGERGVSEPDALPVSINVAITSGAPSTAPACDPGVRDSVTVLTM